MTRSHGHTIVRNAVWSFAGFAWPTLLTLVGVPIFVRYLDVRGYGLWTICNTVLGMVGVLSIGLGDATTKYVAEYSSTGHKSKIRSVFYVTLAMNIILGVMGSIGLWAAGPFLARTVFNLSGSEAMLAVSTFSIVAVGVAPSVAMPVVIGTFNGLQRYRVSQLLLMARTTLTVGFGVCILTVGFGLAELVVVSVVVTWFLFIVGIVLVLNATWTAETVSVSSLRGEFRTVWAFGIFSTFNGISAKCVGVVDKFIVGAVAGLDAVSYYGIGHAIASKTSSASSSLLGVLMPFFSARTADTDEKTLSTMFVKSWRISLLISLSICTPAVASIPWLIGVWIGDDVALHALPVYGLFLGVFLLSAVHTVPYWYLLGRDKPGVVAFAGIANSAIVLVSLFVGTTLYGATGAALGSYAALISQVFLVRQALKYAVGVSFRRDLLSGFSIPILSHVGAVAVGLLGGLAVSILTGRPIFSLFASLLCSVVFMLQEYIRLRDSDNPYMATIWVPIRGVLGTKLPARFRAPPVNA